ncbi:protein BatD [Flavobacterium columnare]|uniref:BatD family protein n=1 Tax=Flavobacterium columnare TaxID=996 RepID=UPI002D2157DF|nr:BatD family protein [Flavobacterium columnare]MEB3801144.1 protein BatD [Flavobacterium columnare]
MKKLFFILILFCVKITAQVQFVTNVSKNNLGINERLRIDFTMNDDGDNFDPPAFDGFRIIGGPNQSVSYSWINGRKSYEKTYSYFLQPTKKGTFVIKGASVEINGQTYKSNAIKITIGNAVPEERDPYDPYGGSSPYYQQQRQQVPPSAAMGKEGVHLVAEISNTNPYLNEPITVVYKIYVSHRSGVGGWQETQNPKYNNFWSQNIDIKQLQVEEGKFKGEMYRYAVLRKTVLYPQKAGKLVIEPLTLDVEVEVPSGEVDFFGRPIMTMGHKKVSAGAKTVTVKPLPEAGKPIDFTGAVGNFDFKVIPSKTSVKVGESIDLKIAVSGTGNLKLFTLPKPVVPSSLEIYDPQHQESVQTPLSGMTGSIQDTYTIIPQSEGKYLIKPMTFTYFDLSSKVYKSITSKEITLFVEKGNLLENNTMSSNKSKVTAVSAFGFIKTKTNLQPKNSSDFLGSGFFYSLLMAPFLAIPLIIAFRRKREKSNADVIGNKIKLSNKLAKKYLSEAQKQLGNKEPFYIALERALHNFLKAKLHIETSDISKDKIRELLVQKKASEDTVAQFIALVESCEFARYAPSTNTSIQNDYNLAVSIISDLEKQIA